MTSERIDYGIRLSPIVSENTRGHRLPSVLKSIRELLTGTPNKIVTVALTETDRENYPHILEFIKQCADEATVIPLIYDTETQWAENIDMALVYGHIDERYCQEVPALRKLQENTRIFRMLPPERFSDPIEFEPVPTPE